MFESINSLPLAARTLAVHPRGYVAPGVAARQRDMGEFATFGEFMGSAMRAFLLNGGNSAGIDDRLSFEASAPTTVGSERAGAGIDGGFVVPVQFVSEVARKLFLPDALLMRCDVRSTQTGSLMIPKDESSPWQPSGGVQAFWVNENTDLNLSAASKAALGGTLLRCSKIAAFVPVTDELMADGGLMAEHVSAIVPGKFQFLIEQAILSGSGDRQPLGVIKAPGTVTVAKESGQTAGTIVVANVEKLWTALTPAARRNATFVVHPDADTQLAALPYPIYQPASDLAPFGRLMGRPIYTSEACSAIGTVGDIVAGDFSAYLAAITTLRQAVSVHLWFDRDVQALRFTLRIDGQPWTSKTIPSLNGGAQRGFFATLAAR